MSSEGNYFFLQMEGMSSKPRTYDYGILNTIME